MPQKSSKMPENGPKMPENASKSAEIPILVRKSLAEAVFFGGNAPKTAENGEFVRPNEFFAVKIAEKQENYKTMTGFAIAKSSIAEFAVWKAKNFGGAF
jgi:hypothetical protein